MISDMGFVLPPNAKRDGDSGEPCFMLPFTVVITLQKEKNEFIKPLSIDSSSYCFLLLLSTAWT